MQKAPGVSGLVLDLRSNPGGSLDEAVALSDIFLDKGDIVSQRGRLASENQYYRAEEMPQFMGDAARGLPMVRAMVLEFPDDLNCRYLDMQYMLGDALLVAPLFNANREGVCYLPAGEWRHLLSGEVVQGGGWHKATYDYFSLPLWVHTERGQAWSCLAGFTT